MNAAITTTRSSLLESHGCTPLCQSPIYIGFDISSPIIFQGETVTFTNNTINGLASKWFVDGTELSSLTNFFYQFNAIGEHVVKLIVTNGDQNCRAEIRSTISVECPAQASFELTSPAPYAIGNTISTINASQNATGYSWFLDGQFVNNQFTFSRQFNQPGGHSLLLVADGSGCSDTSYTKYFTVGNCSGSKITQNWKFVKNGLTFADIGIGYSGSALFDSQTECTSTISDADGNLLFFTDGINVFNRFSIQMPNGNGLLGNLSTTQGVLITPYPGSNHLYYIFTVDASENQYANGMRYSIVDMNLDGGFGDIIPSTKNTLLQNGTGEKLSATFHENGEDIWVASAAHNTNEYYVFLLTSAGINTLPVISSLGAIAQQGLGSIKFSHDGNRLAACVISYYPWNIVLMDFNKATGKLSHAKNLSLSSTENEQPFSLEFSPDNSKLYVSLWQYSRIYQYNLEFSTASQISASQTLVTPFDEIGYMGHLLLARNGTIYFFSAHTQNFDAITNPNAAGLACMYVENEITFSENIKPSLALPNMLQGYIQARKPQIVGPRNVCMGGNTFNFGISYAAETDSAIWSHTGNGIFNSANQSNIGNH